MDKFLYQFLMCFAATPGDETPPAGGGSGGGDGPTGGNEPTNDPSDDGDEPLGEAGKKALQAERDARKQAEKRATELEAQLQQATTDQSSVQAANEALAEAQRDAETAKAEALRYRIAGRYGISTEPGEDEAPSDADMFLTGSTEEELTNQAKRIEALRKTSLENGLVDPTQGGGGRPAPIEVDPGSPRMAAAFDAQLTTK